MQDHTHSFFLMFVSYLCSATQEVGPRYIQLPVAGKERPQYRERVYCYELYHCLRTIISNDCANNYERFPFELNGEIDKSGHPYIRGNDLDKIKPDFLVHYSGDMEWNLVAMEVKPVNATLKGIAKDLRSLTALVKLGHYYRAIYLIYGHQERPFLRLRNFANHFQYDFSKDVIDLDIIDLYWHQGFGGSAIKYDWR